MRFGEVANDLRDDTFHNLAQSVLKCTIAMRIEEPQFTPPYNYAKTNWKELNKRLELYLPTPINDDETTATGIDNYAKELVEAITKAVQETTPHKRPSPHSKRWWTAELSTLRKESNRLRNIFSRTNHAVDKAAWKDKANEYEEESARAKVSKWKEYVNNADGKTIWQIKKYITNIPTSTFIPTLNGHAATYEQKVNALRKAFFPKPPLADLTDIPSAVHPQEIPYEAQITIQQIREAVNRLAPDKAPGPDEISNRVLKNALPAIEHHLQALMQASLKLGHF